MEYLIIQLFKLAEKSKKEQAKFRFTVSSLGEGMHISVSIWDNLESPKNQLQHSDSFIQGEDSEQEFAAKCEAAWEQINSEITIK